jgi:hypothetical protein
MTTHCPRPFLSPEFVAAAIVVLPIVLAVTLVAVPVVGVAALHKHINRKIRKHSAPCSTTSS